MKPFGHSPSKSATGPPPKPNPNGITDVKPRLTKEQHDILEAHFQHQNKPSTNTKKGFAETLNVPLDKINNWFQNRRAKVKQDAKKAQNQQNMHMNMYSQLPMVASQYPLQLEQPQPQPPMAQGFFSPAADLSSTSLPLPSVEGPSALDMGSQVSLHQPFDMHALRSIPETDRTASYDSGLVMQSIMAASAGPSYMQNPLASLPQAPAGMYAMGPSSEFPDGFQSDLTTSLPNGLPNGLPDDLVTSTEALSGFGGFSALNYSSLTSTAPSSSMEPQYSAGSVSSEPSSFSGAHSVATTQSSNGPNASSVNSLESVYSNWTDEQSTESKPVQGAECDNQFNNNFYDIPQASASDPSLFWGQGPPLPHTDMYQHSTGSAQGLLFSSGHADARKMGTGQTDPEAPFVFSDDAYSRRNSSTTNLANTIEAISIQTPDGFKQPNPPSSIAARRQKRPTALNPNTLRSSSYSSGMPSPGGRDEHTLRRIRSTGIPNAAGRIQKPNPGSAQRSPMTLTFADAASSPKFARTFSSSSNAPAGQVGSLAPPTPLTPNESGPISWGQQSSTVIKRHAPMPEHSSPESLHAQWSVDSQSAGIHSSGASPPSTPLDFSQLTAARLANDGLYRDTPPQSAPATQQSFPRTAFAQPPQMMTGFHSTTDLTLAQPKVPHIRRPSLPDNGQNALADSQMHFPTQFADMQYDQQLGDMSMEGVRHRHAPFAPPIMMPEFLVHQFHPPQGMDTPFRRTAEPAPKNYTFTNQGPSDFRRPN